MKIHVIESGSKGNSTLLEYNGHLLLIDMGVPLSSLEACLNELGKNVYDIDAMLLTHKHYDHTKGIKYLPPLPIYTGEGSYEGLNVNFINAYEPFELIGLKITPVSISHDVPNPFGFIIESKDEKFVYLTDSGYIPEKTLEYMHNADYYVIESNHNLKKLYQTDRTAELKARISGDKGHLSNEDSAKYMVDLVGDRTKDIILAHLSEESNTPELAIKAYQKKFNKYHINMDKIRIVCASQHECVHGGK